MQNSMYQYVKNMLYRSNVECAIWNVDLLHNELVYNIVMLSRRRNISLRNGFFGRCRSLRMTERENGFFAALRMTAL